MIESFLKALPGIICACTALYSDITSHFVVVHLTASVSLQLLMMNRIVLTCACWGISFLDQYGEITMYSRGSQSLLPFVFIASLYAEPVKEN